MFRTPVSFSILAILMVTGLALIAAPATAQCPASDTRYSIVDLGTLGGTLSGALDIDDSSRVVGASFTAENFLHPFLWENGVMTDLGTLGGDSGSSAGGINALGEITGQSDNAASLRRAFLYAGGTMSEVPTPPGLQGRGFDINNLGQIVGIFGSGALQYAFLYDTSSGMFSDLGVADPGDTASTANAVNESSQIAAWSGAANPLADAQAYLYEDGMWFPLGTLGGSSSAAFGLDDSGRVVGWSYLAGDATRHAFLWANDQMTDLGTLGGPSSEANGVHTSGPVVGWAHTSDGSQHAFVHAGGEMADLNTLIPPGTGWGLNVAVSVNALGQIVGRGAIGNGSHAYLATPATVTVDELSDLVESFDLPHGIENSFLVKLNNARAALESCTPTAACGSLGAFVNQVEAQSGKHLTTPQADALLAAAGELQATLGCP